METRKRKDAKMGNKTGKKKKEGKIIMCVSCGDYQKKKKKKHIQPVFYCLAFVVVSGDVCSCVRFIGAEGV